MSKTWGKTPLALALLVLPASSRATVDAIIDYTIIYQQLQTDDLCAMRLPALAALGVPQASAMKAVFSPTRLFNDRATSTTYSNINLVMTNPPMIPAYVSDGFSGATMEYAMTINVAMLSSANGDTLEGRRRTVTSAKLALLAMAYTLDDMSQGNFRLTVRFLGLPSQAGLRGTRLYATTTYPYSSASPLLAAYGSELLNVNGTCPAR